MTAVTPIKSNCLVPSDALTSSSRLKSIGLTKTHQRFQSNVISKGIKWEENTSFVQKRLKTEEKNGVIKRKISCRAEGVDRGFLVGTEAGRVAEEKEERRRESGLFGFVLTERLKVVSLVAFVMCFCNADRVVMSVAIVPLAEAHGWSSSFLGIVQSSFLWGYIFSSVIGGALADKYGGKRVLAWGVTVWSLDTLLTPWAANHSTAMLLAVRAVFGLAEGVAFPSMNTLLSSCLDVILNTTKWFPCNERASAVGISMAGFHIGNVISFLLTPIIMSTIGIHGAFALFSSLGLLWLTIRFLTLTVWLPGVTNDPRESRLISDTELELIQAGKTETITNSGKLPSLRELFSKIPTWAIVFAKITNNWGYFVLLSWMPVYFKTVYNVNLKQAAWFSALPWGMMAIAGYVAVRASDYLIIAGYSITLVRKIMQSIGFIGPGVSLLCLNYAKTPAAASVCLTAALSLSAFSQAGFLLNMQDIAPQYAGFLHGITNSVGTLAAIVSTIGTGYSVGTLTAVLYFITTVFWNVYATRERVFY
ncbi:hypothetical protein C5167_047102 [Papaver somniferum]|uniref:Major facilitator superfamily (MFS) profile domain-containing protein n=1 Tax=Papaver somniferum TaxID=3469 RepID=A0A4Y7LFM7_PAPSO|nr:hypothetical protein C5167_047102 [Papaver somniferum]